jgi:hypothetical protein
MRKGGKTETDRSYFAWVADQECFAHGSTVSRVGQSSSSEDSGRTQRAAE